MQTGGRAAFAGYGGVFNVTPDVDPVRARRAAAEREPQQLRPRAADGARLHRHLRSRAARSCPRGDARRSNGHVQGWGADNGRWNLDFADGKTAHVVGCATRVSTATATATPGYVLVDRRLHEPRRAGARRRSSTIPRRAGRRRRASTAAASTSSPTTATTYGGSRQPTPSRSTTSPTRRRPARRHDRASPARCGTSCRRRTDAPLRARQRATTRVNGLSGSESRCATST